MASYIAEAFSTSSIKQTIYLKLDSVGKEYMELPTKVAAGRVALKVQ